MIIKPTVLILGAGASVDYGFPTGRQLLFEICEDPFGNGKPLEYIKEHMDTDSDFLIAFAEALFNSASPSVDLFLEKNPKYEEVGKLAITVALMLKENYENLRLSRDIRWCEILFHRMVDGDRFDENKLSVITFNYERSLEAFLYRTLKNLYGLDSEGADKLLRSLEIIHVHGSLGERLEGIGIERGYQPNLRADWVRKAAQGIRILHQAERQNHIDRAAMLLERAQEVIFLGFSFHDVNMRRLRLDTMSSDNPRSWYACRTGMGEADIARVKSQYNHLNLQFAPSNHWKIDDFLNGTCCLIP